MNKVIIIGNLTRDVELNETNSGKAVARMTVAVSRDFVDKDGNRETDFFNVVVWGNQAENCAKHLSKGKKCCVVGRLENRSWEDNDGNKRISTEIIAEQVEFLSPKQQDEETVSLRKTRKVLEEIEDNQLPF